jgi:hypothetical protein
LRVRLIGQLGTTAGSMILRSEELLSAAATAST